MNRPRLIAGARAASLALALGGLGACNEDIWDVDVYLASHSYRADFGAAMGTVPVEACDPAAPSVCSAGQQLAVTSGDLGPAGADVSVAIGCDAATSRCYALGRVRLAYQLDVLQDDDFATKVARRAVTFVRKIDFAYTVPANTLTFDVPQIDLYVGPAGTKTEADPGVVRVDTIPSVAARATFADEPRHLLIAEGSEGHAFIERHVRDKLPFVFVLATSPRLEAGAPIPAGAFQLDVSPTLGLGLD